MILDSYDLKDLERAKWLLENPGFTAKITNLLGTPIEKGFEMLPQNWKYKVGQITHSALSRAVSAAVLTLNDEPYRQSSNLWHKIAVGTTGGISGFFGLSALAIELPISTTIMLRSIADIARSEGELMTSLSTKIACMEVFAFGGTKNLDDAYESAYFVARAALASSVANAAEYIAERGLVEGSPALVRLIIQIADRFSVQVSEKAVTQALPAIGAAGGVIINTLFIDHFQDMARGHFIVRRLENKYGADVVKSTYENMESSGSSDKGSSYKGSSYKGSSYKGSSYKGSSYK
ncbi:MAG: EcsC family protein [Desulfamplus sp.]|nr:EcsC family protein [Desulfamplus sp.]